MYDHITDQGVAYGSCWGNIHHYGYSVRGLYPAYFLMKDVLREEGKLLQAERTLRWYAITNEVYPKPDGNRSQSIGRRISSIAASPVCLPSSECLRYARWFVY